MFLTNRYAGGEFSGRGWGFKTNWGFKFFGDSRATRKKIISHYLVGCFLVKIIFAGGGELHLDNLIPSAPTHAAAPAS